MHIIVRLFYRRSFDTLLTPHCIANSGRMIVSFVEIKRCDEQAGAVSMQVGEYIYLLLGVSRLNIIGPIVFFYVWHQSESGKTTDFQFQLVFMQNSENFTVKVHQGSPDVIKSEIIWLKPQTIHLQRFSNEHLVMCIFTAYLSCCQSAFQRCNRNVQPHSQNCF